MRRYRCGKQCFYVRQRLRGDWLIGIVPPLAHREHNWWIGVVSSPANRALRTAFVLNYSWRCLIRLVFVFTCVFLSTFTFFFSVLCFRVHAVNCTTVSWASLGLGPS